MRKVCNLCYERRALGPADSLENTFENRMKVTVDYLKFMWVMPKFSVDCEDCGKKYEYKNIGDKWRVTELKS